MLFDGAFPDSLIVNDRTINPAMEKIFMKKGWKITKDTKPGPEQLQEMVKIVSEVTRGIGFATSLPLEADAHYAGKGVLRGAVNTPVFWYRPKNVEKYHVVYAHLSILETDSRKAIFRRAIEIATDLGLHRGFAD